MVFLVIALVLLLADPLPTLRGEVPLAVVVVALSGYGAFPAGDSAISLQGLISLKQFLRALLMLAVAPAAVASVEDRFSCQRVRILCMQKNVTSLTILTFHAVTQVHILVATFLLPVVLVSGQLSPLHQRTGIGVLDDEKGCRVNPNFSSLLLVIVCEGGLRYSARRDQKVGDAEVIDLAFW